MKKWTMIGSKKALSRETHWYNQIETLVELGWHRYTTNNPISWIFFATDVVLTFGIVFTEVM